MAILLASTNPKSLPFLVPGRAIRTSELPRGLGVAGDIRRLPVPPEGSPQPHRHVAQVTGDRGAVGTREVRDRLLTRLHAVDEVAGVGQVLGGAIPGRVLDRLGPRLFPASDRHGLRAADGV